MGTSGNIRVRAPGKSILVFLDSSFFFLCWFFFSFFWFLFLFKSYLIPTASMDRATRNSWFSPQQQDFTKAEVRPLTG